MHTIDVFRLATRNFRSNKLRTFLTILAVSVATSAILFLVSFGYGLQLLTVQRIANSATISTVDVVPINTKSLIKLDDTAISRIKSIPQVTKVAAELDVEGQAKVGSVGSTVVHAVPKDYFELADIRPAIGSLFSDTATHEVVVSTGFLSQFNLPKDTGAFDKPFQLTYTIAPPEQGTGKTNRVVDETPYSIVGAITDDDTSYIYLPLSQALTIVKGQPYANLKVQASDRSKVVEVKDAITTLGYDASAPLETLQQLDRIFAIVQAVLGGLGVVALIISSIGMFNTMTIALLERTREIGIMKSLGAGKSDVWKLFLAEATIIGFSGGLAGVLMGTGLAFGANTVLNVLARRFGGESANIFYSPPWFIVSIIIFSTVVGAITGFYPARRAANLNPLKALRYE